MIRETKLILLFFLIQIQLSCEYQNNVIQLINDIINTEHKPTSLIINTAWNKNDNVKFFNLNVPITFLSSDVQQFAVPQNIDGNKIVFIIDLNFQSGYKFMDVIDKNYFRQPYRWIIIHSDEIEENILKRINCLTDSDIILAQINGSSIVLKQIYKIDEYSNIIYESYGLWTDLNGFIDLRETSILSRRRKNLMGKELTASIVITNNDTYEHLTDYKNKHIDSIVKVNYVFTNQLIEILNGTPKFTFVNTWGYKDKSTGNWSGMVGELIRKEAVLGGTALFITPDRVEFIEFISMTTPTRVKFVFRAPPLSYVSNIYYLPFEGLVWICSGCLVIISIIIIYITYNFVQNKYFNCNGDKVNNVSFTDIMLLGVGAVCQKGSHLEPKIISGRISTIFLFIALLFLYTSYTANIVALLQSTTRSITTLYDLLHSQLEFGVDDTPYNRYYFPAATDPIRQAIYRTKILQNKQPAKYMNISYGVSRLRQGLFAFNMECGPGYKLVEETFYEHEKCDLIEIGFIQVVYTWYAIQKYSPYKEMLKINVFKIREHGIQSREVSKIYTNKPLCDSRGQTFGSVRLIDCYAALLVLVYGFILSIILFILEKICYRNKLVGAKD